MTLVRLCADAQVDAEYSNGKLSDGWKISLSTLPWREGQVLDVAALFTPGADAWEEVGVGGQIAVRENSAFFGCKFPDVGLSRACLGK
eukprot:COSAG06_NODE_5699_length_3313_cov_19.925949_2_plen_88_part_00